MRWLKGKPTDTAIVTYIGRPGAAAAAALLLEYPEAGLFITSPYSLPRRLTSLAERNFLKRVFLCGMGSRSGVEEVEAGLRELAESGKDVTWFCGAYWEMEEPQRLGKSCDLRHSTEEDSDLGVIVSELGMESGRMQLLEAVGDFEAELDEESAEFADMVEAAKSRYFQFSDFDAYPLVIRKLAGQLPVVRDDREMVANWAVSEVKEGPDGCSEAVRALRRNLETYGALNDARVLIMGESGVGKEIAARALHKASPRFRKQFFSVNCATLTRSGLLDSRLFGHEKGAFTGAVEARQGILEAADGGTLFLDEVGELPVETQAKLLRVLEDGCFQRLGSTEERRTDVRVVSATNRDLAEMVDNGGFRNDLYYRLSEFYLRIPPLRHRPEDIPLIANSLRRRLEKRHNRSFQRLTDREVGMLQDYSWPGNVRQLFNVLQRYYVLGGRTDLAGLLEEERRIVGSKPEGAADKGGAGLLPTELTEDDVVAEEQLQREYAMLALKACGGNKTQTASKLGISVNTLNKRLRSV